MGPSRPADGRWAVFFDLEGTLVVRATRLEEVIETVLYAHDRVRSSDAVGAAVVRALTSGSHPGPVPSPDLYARIFRLLSLEPDVERLSAAVAEACRRIDPPILAPGAPAALELLRGGGAVLGVITNADGSVRDLLGRLGLARHLEVVMTPSRGGATKPDTRIFEAALREAGVDAANAWHVGDDPEGDARGAVRAGLHAVLVRGRRAAAAPAIDGTLVASRVDEAAAMILERRARGEAGRGPSLPRQT